MPARLNARISVPRPEFEPDLSKLDISLTRDIDTDAARRALTCALVGFATSTGCRIIAEGVERAPAMEALRAIGVEKAQGYFLGRPMSALGALALARDHSVVDCAASRHTDAGDGQTLPCGQERRHAHAFGKDITKP